MIFFSNLNLKYLAGAIAADLTTLCKIVKETTAIALLKCFKFNIYNFKINSW